MTMLMANIALNDFKEFSVLLRKCLVTLVSFRKVQFKHNSDLKGIDDFRCLSVDYKSSTKSRVTDFMSVDPMTGGSIIFVVQERLTGPMIPHPSNVFTT